MKKKIEFKTTDEKMNWLDLTNHTNISLFQNLENEVFCLSFTTKQIEFIKDYYISRETYKEIINFLNQTL